MAVDKVKPLGLENSALGGTEDVPFPRELNPAEDYLAAKGLALENSDDHRVERVGNEVAFYDPVSGAKKVSDVLDAEQENFDPTGSGLVSVKTGPALRELYDLTQNSSRSYIFGSYGGNANVGRYLEFFPSISSDDAPIYSANGLDVLTIVTETVASSDTCTIGWYDISGGLPGTLLHTTTFSGVKRVIEDSGTVFSLAATGELAVKVDSGSISKPHFYIIFRGS